MPATLDGPTYRDLLTTEEPHPIKNQDEASAIQRRIDVLIEKAHLSEAEQEYLALLGFLVIGWEEGRYVIPELTVPEILHALVEDNGLRQVDLVGPVFSSRGIVSEVFSGKRSLTYSHVARLAEYFHVSPALFYPSAG